MLLDKKKGKPVAFIRSGPKKPNLMGLMLHKGYWNLTFQPDGAANNRHSSSYL